ncbi:gamma-glutamyl-gamma-aminobutyrate hydrolase family protein [Brachybacterium sp. UNK5269]|uniref:gamma-glutamyl-gamma-aminobutyrate hydrolase family protein n=1 Tax=Brachybacterium sp. UNK5269 TaxID=3408576 RepID=UPI003BB0B894
MAQRTRRPLIGVTAGTTAMMSGAWAGHDAVRVNDSYVQALRAAGARAVIIAPQDDWSDEEVAELDGLVLTGGTDLDPAGWGEGALPTDMTPDPQRDAFETALYRAARRSGVPVLGICRGLQVIVIAEGGDLHRHLPTDLPGHPATGQRPTRVVAEIDAASDLGVALGTRAAVTAYHHQGIRTVRGALRIVARHASGLPLAVEADSGSAVLGVQWHPEIDGQGGAAVVESLLTAIRHRQRSASTRALV